MSERTADELLKNYTHAPEEFPVLMEQTHKVLRDGRIVNERININENLIHYVRDTALLISKIDGRIDCKTLKKSDAPYDHVIYLDKSARPVSWLVNLFWKDFARNGENGAPVKRPAHSYLNIDRSPWFRKVGIKVTDDGRQMENGELAQYSDFVNALPNLDPKHLAAIRSLYIDGGIDCEDTDWVMSHPTVLDGKRILVVDEVSRTGATMDIAKHVISLALPDAACVDGTYFWNPEEPPLMAGGEKILTSLPVWYDPSTETGRGIGGPNAYYYRGVYEAYEKRSEEAAGVTDFDLNKLRTHAFAASVFSAPLLDKDGKVLSLVTEQKTRNLSRDLLRLHREYQTGRIFFAPPRAWMTMPDFRSRIEVQGVLILSGSMSPEEAQALRESPLFYLNFLEKLKKQNSNHPSSN